jgi:uncharacterized repeat protein (TIGR03803 family)
VYKVDAASHETTLYTFTFAPDGTGPQAAGVIRDWAGNLYGTTGSGGAAGAGVVYKLDPAGKETVLYTFSGGADGASPQAGVIRDSAGNLYGTTFDGGNFNANCAYGYCGVVYKLDASGHETVLYSFTGGIDGGNPLARVIRDPAGNLYGTTYNGGNFNSNCANSYCGVVYELDVLGVETAMYSFTGGADGGNPVGGVIRDSTGNLYGSTFGGGNSNPNCTNSYCGVVYKVDAIGLETVLYRFTGGADGGNPNGDLIRDSAGNLYGTTSSGGTANQGVVYVLDAAGHETVLYSFIGGADGGSPLSGVIRDSAGNLYGTAYRGGAAGWGVVYKMNATGHETVLYSFTNGADGGNPVAGVILDSAGNLYGTTYHGGNTNYGAGVVFEITGVAPAQ